MLVAKVNLGVPVSADPTEPPAATAKFPLASSVDVADGVCRVVVPPPVTKAVEVREPDATTVTVPDPPSVTHVPVEIPLDGVPHWRNWLPLGPVAGS